MKKTLIALALVLVCAVGANAQYTGPFAQTWSTGLGNLQTLPWVFTGNSGVAWNGKIYANDAGAYAELNLNTLLGLNFNGLADTANSRNFVLQADLYNLATNFIQDMGIGMVRSSDKRGIEMMGCNAGNQGANAIDHAWDNTNSRQSWTQDPAANGVNPITVQVDYGYTVANKFSVKVLGAVGSSYPGTWRSIHTNKDVHPGGDYYNILRIGDQSKDLHGGSWGQLQVDNIKLQYVVPEPGSVIALGAGLLGMLGMLRNKK